MKNSTEVQTEMPTGGLTEGPTEMSAVVPTEVAKMSDPALFDLCKKYGKNAKVWMRKFAVLIPEVFKRGLYKRRGFISIYEFAAKMGGMGHSAVEQILSLDRVLQDKPALRSLVEEYGWSKVRVVASYATKETDEMWADKVKIMPKNALEVYVRGIKMQDQIEEGARRGLFGRGKIGDISGGEGTAVTGGKSGGAGMVVIDSKSGNADTLVVDCKIGGGENPTCNPFPGERLSGSNYTADFEDLRTTLREEYLAERRLNESVWPTIAFKVDPETEFRLKLLKQKIEKERKEKVSFGELLKIMIEKVEEKTVENAAMPTKKEPRKEPIKEPAEEKPKNYEKKKPTEFKPKDNYTFSYTPVSRYIPVEIKRHLQEKYGGRCGFPGCNNPMEILHHTRRFSLYRAHDVSSIVPLCRAHHDISHTTLIDKETKPNENWWLEKEVPSSDSLDGGSNNGSNFLERKIKIDEKVRKFKSG